MRYLFQLQSSVGIVCLLFLVKFKIVAATPTYWWPLLWIRSAVFWFFVPTSAAAAENGTNPSMALIALESTSLFVCVVDCFVQFDAVAAQCNSLFLRSGVAEAVPKVTSAVQMCMCEVHQSTLRDGYCGLLSSKRSRRSSLDCLFSLVLLGCLTLCLVFLFYR